MITLREISREDIPAINRWRRDQVVIDGVGAPRRFIGLDVDLRWYEDYLSRRGGEVRCAVCLENSGQLVGMVSLTRIDYVHSNAEFNAVVGEHDAQNRGIGTAAARAMVAHGFADLNLHRIYVSILRDNVGSIRMCEKAGFREEGVMRDAAYKNGRYHDMVLMGVLREDVLGPDVPAAEPKR
jgi:RimJ/RimL family protein N-acetyltransferase